MSRERNIMVSRNRDTGRLCCQRRDGQRDSRGRSQRGCYGKPATSGLRNAPLATLSSHSHRRRLRGTQRPYIWHSGGTRISARCTHVRNNKDSRFFSWASSMLSLANCLDTTSQFVGEHGNRISRNLAFGPRPRGLPHALPILTPVPSPL
jgi:hypothetical protein